MLGQKSNDSETEMKKQEILTNISAGVNVLEKKGKTRIE